MMIYLTLNVQVSEATADLRVGLPARGDVSSGWKERVDSGICETGADDWMALF